MDIHLSALFSVLNACDLRYCLLTDFECDFLSNDIDLYVHPEDKAIFEQMLLKQKWYKRKEPAHHVNHHFYYSPATRTYLDVKYSLTFANGPSTCFTYKYGERALSTATLNLKAVRRPVGIDAILLYAAHLAFKERGKVEDKHKEYLNAYLSNYQTEASVDSTELIGLISDWLCNSFPNDLAKLRLIIASYFHIEHREMIRKGRLKYGLGVKVLFLGTDGSGKTTLIQEVRKDFNLKTSSLYLGTGENGWTTSVIKTLCSYKAKPRLLHRLLGILKMYVVLPLEFTLRVIPVKFRSKYRVTLIDRFPGRVFLENGTFKLSYYKLLLPKPDIVFFLYANPEDLVKRKPDEVSLESGRADIEKFRKVAQVVSRGNYKEINTSAMTIAESRDYIISEIYSHPKVYKQLLTTNFSQV